MTDPKLAGGILARMQPNIENFRTILKDNAVNSAEFTMSWVEMLERGARDEPLGRVHRTMPGEFY